MKDTTSGQNQQGSHLPHQERAPLNYGAAVVVQQLLFTRLCVIFAS